MVGALARRGLDVQIAAVFPYQPVDGIEHIPVVRIGRRRDGGTSLAQSAYTRLIEHMERIRGLLRAVRVLRPDVLHLHGAIGKFDFMYFRLARFFGARVVCTVHDVGPFKRLDLFNRFRYHAADLIIVHSSNSVTTLVDHYGLKRSKITELPHASVFSTPRDMAWPRATAIAALGLPAEARIVLFFGDITRRKGLDLLIDAHALVCRHHPQTHLIIAGEPSEDFGVYRDRIAQHGLGDRVMIDLRYVPSDRVNLYFSAADIVALPYRAIYQSHVLQWAYAFGRPVVATAVGGLGEAVSADGTGLVVGGEDVEALARAISRLLADGDLARSLGDRGLEMTRTKYSWEAVSALLDGAYRSVLGSGADPEARMLRPADR